MEAKQPNIPAPMFARADALRLPLADDCADAVIGSPPYADARTYGIDAQRGLREWVEWMVPVTIEALRVAPVVLWVCDDVVRRRAYLPCVPTLIAELFHAGVTLERPLIWRSNKAPSRHGEWWTHAWEYMVCAKRKAARLPHFNWRATATPTKHPTAGSFRQRRKDGTRPPRLRKYVAPELAHPRDVIYAKVGGGHMGHPLATENEAPFPEALVEQLIPVLVPVGGRVVDPFSGSGTTANVAHRLGRVGIGFDLRMSQCLLGRERFATPAKPKSRRRPKAPAASAATLFDAAAA